MSKPGYKKTALGWIPEEWDLDNAGRFITTNSGFAFKSESYLENPISNEVRLLRGDNVCQGYIRWKDAKWWMRENGDKLDGFLLEYGDIVIAMDRTWVSNGLKVAEIKECDLPCLLVQRVARIRAKSNFCQDLLKHIFSTHRFEQYVKGVQTETAVPHISLNQIKEYPIVAPPLPEQIKIAQILSAWDKAITQTQQLIEAKQRLKQGLMQQLLTGRIRFKEFGSLVRKFGEIPSGWEKVYLDSLFKPIKQKNKSGCKRVLTASGQLGLVAQQEYFNRDVSGADLEKYYLLKKGEFAYNRSSMKAYPFGAIKRLDRYDEGIVSTLYLCFSLVNEQDNSDFYRHYFESGLFNKALSGIVQVGARAHGLLNVANEDFFNLHIIKPSPEEQKKIAEVLNEAEKQLQIYDLQLIKLKEQKQGLMQKLLTGQIRVKVEEGLQNGAA